MVLGSAQLLRNVISHRTNPAAVPERYDDLYGNRMRQTLHSPSLGNGATEWLIPIR